MAGTESRYARRRVERSARVFFCSTCGVHRRRGGAGRIARLRAERVEPSWERERRGTEAGAPCQRWDNVRPLSTPPSLRVAPARCWPHPRSAPHDREARVAQLMAAHVRSRHLDDVSKAATPSLSPTWRASPRRSSTSSRSARRRWPPRAPSALRAPHPPLTTRGRRTTRLSRSRSARAARTSSAGGRRRRC